MITKVHFGKAWVYMRNTREFCIVLSIDLYITFYNESLVKAFLNST